MRAINRRKAIAGAKVSIVPSAGAAHCETVTDARLLSDYRSRSRELQRHGRRRWIQANRRNVANGVYYLKDFGNYDVIPDEPRELSGRVTYRFYNQAMQTASEPVREWLSMVVCKGAKEQR
jgi:hypothetical protein